jgi:hypothetical protein
LARIYNSPISWGKKAIHGLNANKAGLTQVASAFTDVRNFIPELALAEKRSRQLVTNHTLKMNCKE